MPCHAAITDKTLSFPLDTDVETAIKELKKKKLEIAAIIDENGKLEGILSLKIIMKNLLPVSVAMAGGLQVDVTVRAAPGIAKRLRKVYPLTVGQIMDRKFDVVYPETPIWEGVNALVNGTSPIAVVDGQSGKFISFLTQQSAIDELQRLEQSDS